MMKSTLLLVILVVALAEGQITAGGRTGRSLPQHCEGRLEFIASPSDKGYQLKTVGERKKNIRASSRESYKAKSYGNCCWILYSR